MSDTEFSKHAKHMLLKRRILEEWVWRVLDTPDRKRRGDDNNMHYTKVIRENDGRVLHIVVNTDVQPHLIVTLFFDRRAGKKK